MRQFRSNRRSPGAIFEQFSWKTFSFQPNHFFARTFPSCSTNKRCPCVVSVRPYITLLFSFSSSLLSFYFVLCTFFEMLRFSFLFCFWLTFVRGQHCWGDLTPDEWSCTWKCQGFIEDAGLMAIAQAQGLLGATPTIWNNVRGYGPVKNGQWHMSDGYRGGCRCAFVTNNGCTEVTAEMMTWKGMSVKYNELEINAPYTCGSPFPPVKPLLIIFIKYKLEF